MTIVKWGIVVEWDVGGLTHCTWMQRSYPDTVDDPREFDTEADAAAFIRNREGRRSTMGLDADRRILTTRAMTE